MNYTIMRKWSDEETPKIFGAYETKNQCNDFFDLVSRDLCDGENITLRTDERLCKVFERINLSYEYYIVKN